MNKTIILGSSGTIGKYLMKRFTEEGFHTEGYNSDTCNLLEDIHLDISEDDHIIMASSITRRKEDSYNSLQKNIEMAHNISVFLKDKKFRSFVYLSTIDVFNLNSYHSISKITSENIIKMNLKKVLILRLSGVYGAGESVVESLISQARQGEINLTDEKAERGFLYIEDIFRRIKMNIKFPIDSTEVLCSKLIPMEEVKRKIEMKITEIDKGLLKCLV